MRLANYLKYVISVIVILLLHGYAMADGSNLGAPKILAVIPVKSGNIDQSVYRQFDQLVPELRKISNNKIVKLECRYSGQSDREQDVDDAYKLAGRIEKYLRVHHKLDLDLWVAIDITPKAIKAVPVLTIAVFLDKINKVSPVHPPKNEQL